MNFNSQNALNSFCMMHFAQTVNLLILALTISLCFIFAIVSLYCTIVHIVSNIRKAKIMEIDRVIFFFDKNYAYISV